jgi:signal transduction histidine kinase
MNIKTRLSFQFTFFVIIILLICSTLVYYFSFISQRDKFRDNLLIKAKNTAILLIDVKEVDSTLLKKIHQSTISLIDEEIVITDSSFRIIYSNNIQYLTEMAIRTNYGNSNNIFFSIDKKNGVCYKHKLNNQTYNTYVLAFDSDRSENLLELREILIWSFLFSITISVYISYFFSKSAIQPLSNIIRSIKSINATKLSNRINEGNKKDEIEHLAMTFNDMLRNIELAFKSQEEFVLNAAHELRTPLAIMISESDYLLSHIRKPEEYTLHIGKMINDLKNLNSMAYSLLELAQLNKDNEIQLSEVRIDEIIYNSILQIKGKFPDRKILSKIQYSENENDLLINGHSGLLGLAFKNILNNACKFSAEEVITEIKILEKQIKVIIIDYGVGIPSDEINNIFKPFKRATNVKFISGFGIGLSLVEKIIELHKAQIKINRGDKKGTQVEMFFNKKI